MMLKSALYVILHATDYYSEFQTVFDFSDMQWITRFM
jgi:hypothetical protein